VYNPPSAILEAALDSVRRQRFPDWEYCIVNDASTDPSVRTVLDNAAARDRRLRVHHRRTRGGIALATNDALDTARGEFVAFLDHDDELHADALARVAAVIDDDEDVDYLYTDEDKIDERGRHFDPFLKPDWSPDRFRCQMYTAHLSVVRRTLIELVGGLNPEFDGAQDWDLVFRVTEQARRVVHVPDVLYHWRTVAASTARQGSEAKPYAYPAAQRAIDAHLERTSVQGSAEAVPNYQGNFRVRPRLRSLPEISIVIPTAGSRGTVDGEEATTFVVHAIDSIVRRSTYPDYEIVVVVDEDVTADTRKMIARAGGERTRLIPYHGPFNFSDKVNIGANRAEGEHLLFLNDDVEVLPSDWRPGYNREGPSDWLQEMLVYSMQQDVGAVGAKLYFPDGRLQHAGVVIVDGAPTHALYLEPGDAPGYFGAAVLPTNYLAVTGACLMTRRECFDAVGGFDLRLPLNYNDVAYGLALRDAGFRSVFVPDARLLHFESATREAGPVGQAELAYLRDRWPGAIARDPYHHPGFLPGRSDFRLPVYRSSGTFVRPGSLVSNLARARQLLSEGGVRLIAERVRHRLRREDDAMPAS
jgi:O-antigen biosynthesis protein